jgi:hypothetical protein
VLNYAPTMTQLLDFAPFYPFLAPIKINNFFFIYISLK